MIYYSFSKEGNIMFVTKNKVTLNMDNLKKVRDDIKNNCSRVIHHMYYSPSTRINGFDEVTNVSKEINSVREDGIYIYKIEFDEIKYPSIVKQINDVIFSPRETKVTILLDNILDTKEYEKTNIKNRVEDYYEDIRKCFYIRPIATLPISTINAVKEFFNIESDFRTGKLDSTLKRSKRFKNIK